MGASLNLFTIEIEGWSMNPYASHDEVVSMILAQLLCETADTVGGSPKVELASAMSTGGRLEDAVLLPHCLQATLVAHPG